jgi:hypothetical protein
LYASQLQGAMHAIALDEVQLLEDQWQLFSFIILLASCFFL